MSDQITIAGRTFNVPSPFSEGHVLSANEAQALNQTFHENIRNNTAKKIKEKTDEEAQSIVDDYANDYQFGVRSGGGGFRGDAVMTEAMAIAREAVRRGLRAKGYALSGDNKVPATKVTEFAKAALDKHPEWIELAKSRVEEQKAAVAELDFSQVSA